MFLNNRDATADTASTAENGYAGSFHIFGHGICLGDVGHCEVDESGKAPHDFRLGHPLVPQPKTLVVTEALKCILDRDGRLTPVTVVPVAYGRPPAGEADPEGVPEIRQRPARDLRLTRLARLRRSPARRYSRRPRA